MTDPIRSFGPRISESGATHSRGAAPGRLLPEATSPESQLPRAVAQLVAGAGPSRGALLALATESPNLGEEAAELERPVVWLGAKAFFETTCFVLPCPNALDATKALMDDGGLAEQMLDHFLSGSGEPVFVDLNREFERNPRLREFVSSKIEFILASRVAQGLPIEGASGAVWVAQGDYGTSPAGKDQGRAFGGTFFEFSVTGSAQQGGLTATINVADNYFWSPSDASRATQCFHECGAEMVNAGQGVEFDQIGEGQLIVADPRHGERIALPDTNHVQE